MANGAPQDEPAANDPPVGVRATGQQANSSEILALGLGLIVLSLLLVYLLLTLWPAGLSDKERGDAIETVLWFGTSVGFNTTVDVRLLLLVMVTGALGSFVHTATSFSDFVGNQKLSTNWVWWYILRPFIAMALAAIFYVAVRAGLLTSGGQPNTINLYGIAAMAGMVGMFSKQATDKLGEVFDTLFKTAPGGGDLQRKDGLGNPEPILAAIHPATLAPANIPAVVSVQGSGFTAGSVVRVRGSDRPTVFKDPSQLSVTLPVADISAEGQLDLVVVTPPPGGGRSAPLSLRIASAGSTTTSADDNHIDGCDVAVVDPTPDEALPAARGGVS